MDMPENGGGRGEAHKLYRVLGVSSKATASEIKRAYHKLALRYRTLTQLKTEQCTDRWPYASHVLLTSRALLLAFRPG